MLEEWHTYPDPSVVWPEFEKFTRQFHLKQDRQTMHTAPIAAGINIAKFDLPIAARYQQKYGTGKPLFSPRDKIDLLDWFFVWFENSSEVEKYTMDYIREYMGMNTKNAHDALQDVRDEGAVIVRFMKLHRRVAEKTVFKNAFKL